MGLHRSRRRDSCRRVGWRGLGRWGSRGGRGPRGLGVWVSQGKRGRGRVLWNWRSGRDAYPVRESAALRDGYKDLVAEGHVEDRGWDAIDVGGEGFAARGVGRGDDGGACLGLYHGEMCSSWARIGVLVLVG